MIDDDDDREFLELNACAERMGVTPREVLALARRGALRSVNLGFGLLVEPAILA